MHAGPRIGASGQSHLRRSGCIAGSDEHTKLLDAAETGGKAAGAKGQQQGSFIKVEERATGQVEKRLYWVSLFRALLCFPVCGSATAWKWRTTLDAGQCITVRCLYWVGLWKNRVVGAWL